MIKLIKEFLRFKAGMLLKDTYNPKLGDYIYMQVPESGGSFYSDFKQIGNISEIQHGEKETKITITLKRGCSLYKND